MGIKLTTEQFIGKAIKKHGNKYDYSEVDYIGTFDKVKIKCHVHGEFEQQPNNHLFGLGCMKCANNQKLSISDFIIRSREIHGDKYDYSLSNYINAKSKLKIICLIHGVFEQSSNKHLSGEGCPKCVGKNKTTKDFISEAKEKHGNKYDYSEVEYKQSNKKVIISCLLHGQFSQRPDNHLQGQGCPICKESGGEKQIRDFLIKNSVSYIPQKRFKNCKNKYTLPFDFYLPDQNICIEYQGQHHYKPIKWFGGTSMFLEVKKRDEIKRYFCITNNIKLLEIPYDKDVNNILNNYIING